MLSRREFVTVVLLGVTVSGLTAAVLRGQGKGVPNPGRAPVGHVDPKFGTEDWWAYRENTNGTQFEFEVKRNETPGAVDFVVDVKGYNGVNTPRADFLQVEVSVFPKGDRGNQVGHDVSKPQPVPHGGRVDFTVPYKQALPPGVYGVNVVLDGPTGRKPGTLKGVFGHAMKYFEVTVK